MLLFAASALAAPQVPVVETLPVGSLGVAFVASSLRDHLKEVSCEEGQCEALSVDNRLGGAVEYRVLSVLSLYGRAENSEQKLRAADYFGAGWGFGGGVKLGVPVSEMAGVEGWAEYSVVNTGDASNGDSRDISQVDAGVVFRYGNIDEGVVAWGGVSAVPWCKDQPTVLGGTLPLELAPSFPLSATVGAELVSAPLGPVWSNRGRMGLGGSLTLGNQVTVGMRLMASY